MERYIGMDVHAASCTLAIISEKGRKLKDFPIETNGQALVEAIRMIPGHKHLVFEEGLQSAWLYEILNPHVDDIVVAGITTSRGQKSDKSDAYGLAEDLRTGSLDKHVFKAPRQFTRLRELARSHSTLVSDTVRVQARIKALYRSRGILVSGVNVYSIRLRKEWQKQLPSSIQTRTTRLYDYLDFLLEQKKQAEADLLREAKKHRIVKVLETAPGFGPIRAARLVPIVTRSLSAAPPTSLSNEATVLELLRAGHRDPFEFRLGPDSRRQMDQGSSAADARPLAATQSRLEGHLQRRRDDGDYAKQKGSDLRSIRATSRRRNETHIGEVEPGANDCSHGASDVERRKGVRPRTSQSDCKETRRLSCSSIRRIEEKAIVTACNREQSSQATHCVDAKVSIHLFPGPRPTAWRHQG